MGAPGTLRKGLTGPSRPITPATGRLPPESGRENHQGDKMLPCTAMGREAGSRVVNLYPVGMVYTGTPTIGNAQECPWS